MKQQTKDRSKAKSNQDRQGDRNDRGSQDGHSQERPMRDDIAKRDADRVVVIFSNVPDQQSGERIASVLVDSHLAACVNILAPAESIYRWHGVVERARELPLIIKTTASRIRAVEEAMRLHHPYEVPEILVIPVDGGLPAYLRWVIEETMDTDNPCNPGSMLA